MARKFERLLHRGHIKDGALVLENPRWFKGMLQLYVDTPVTILVERRKSSPSAEQFGYLWGVVYPEASQVTGHSPDELHQIMKSLHLSEKHVWRGMEITTVQSTTKLTRNELAEFITNVIVTFNELGIEIPPADKLYQFRDYQQDV